MSNDEDVRADRFRWGMQVLNQIGAEANSAEFIESLAEVSPEFGHQVVAWAYGDIYARPGLVLRDRALVTLGVLTALGGCEPQLQTHIDFALNAGLSPQQITEALLRAAVYCGIPRALNATLVAKKVFAERDLLPVEKLE
jgi:4-carboxymuconolactone decarboxylase